MSVRTVPTGAAACCAFCLKPLPVVDGRTQPWRAPNGTFFCNEFCADDAEEASFRNRPGGMRPVIKAAT